MILLALVLAFSAQAPTYPAGPIVELRLIEVCRTPRYSVDAILDAIREVESGGVRGDRSTATGDGGRAIGPYQIHRAYFVDARIAGRYEDCRDLGFARRVVIAYWKRWCPDALERCDAEVLARVHNGGPRGASRSTTLDYWRKVEAQLLASRSE